MSSSLGISPLQEKSDHHEELLDKDEEERQQEQPCDQDTPLLFSPVGICNRDDDPNGLCEILSQGTSTSLAKAKALLEKFPNAVQVRNEKTGQTPLHFALIHCSHEESFIRQILQAHPASTRMLDVHGTTPLDIVAAKSNDFSETLQNEILHAAYPNFDRQQIWNEFQPKDWHAEQNWNPLHMAMYQRAGLWKVKILLQQDPTLAKGINMWGNYPLHEGLRIYSREDSVRAVLEAYPQVCRAQNLDGAYPLHYAVREATFIPISLIQRILELFPGAASIRAGHMQLTPLHIAITNAASQELILALLKASPEAAQSVSSRGRTPFYECLAKADTPLQATCAVFHAWPDAASVKDRDGQFPLYEAIKNELPQEFVLELLNAHPDVASLVMDQSGRLPLHLAMKHKGGSKLVKRLLELHPEGIMAITKHSETPLLLAMGNNADLESVQLILQADPAAAKMIHPELGTPLHAGMSTASDPKLIRLILAAYPEAAQIRDRRGQTPFHTGIFIKSSANNRDKTMRPCVP